MAIRQACGLWAHRQAILLISRALGKFEFAMKVLVQHAASAFLRTVLPCPAVAGGGGAESDSGRNRQPGTRLEVVSRAGFMSFRRVVHPCFWSSWYASDSRGIDVDALRERAFGHVAQRGMLLGFAKVSKRSRSRRSGMGVQRDQRFEAKVQRAVHSAGAELSLSVAVSSITAPGF